jgi:hypothetical protein
MDRAHIHHYVFEAYGTGGRPLAFPFFLSFFSLIFFGLREGEVDEHNISRILIYRFNCRFDSSATGSL